LQTSYTPADADYMAKRRLRRHARAWARHRLALSPQEQTAIEHRRSRGL
jgi:hypothetical protein